MGKNFNGTQINQSPTISEKAGADVADIRNLILKYDTDGNVVVAADGTAPLLGVSIIESGYNDISGVEAGMVKKGEDVDILIKDIGFVIASAEIKKGQDVFCVGGGSAGGSGNWDANNGYGKAGSGGYTKTQKSIQVTANTAYSIVIGAGGQRAFASGGSTSALGVTANGGTKLGGGSGGGKGKGSGGGGTRTTGPTGTGGSGTAARSTGPGTADAAYIAKVRTKIKNNTSFNASSAIMGNPPVIYDVELLPDGTLRNIRKRKSSGIPGFDEAVLRAIEKSAPYPKDKTGRVPSRFSVTHKPKD